MNVTINTDASHHSDHKVGAFAFWIVSSQGRIIQSGPLKECRDCLDAEIGAIGNAFHALLQSSFVGVRRVYLNCDSIPALSQVRGRSKRARPIAGRVRQLIDQVGAKYKLGSPKTWLLCAHVKAHSGKGSARKWVNDWCDQQAGLHMRRQFLQKRLKP